MSEIHTMIDHKDDPDDLKPQTEGGAIEGLKAMEPDISGFVYELISDEEILSGIFTSIYKIENFVINEFIKRGLILDEYCFEAKRRQLNTAGSFLSIHPTGWSAKLCRSEDTDPHEWQLTVKNHETETSSVHFLKGGAE